MQKRRSITIIEVAKRARVSPSTVSRVLNGTAVVVPETEQRVRQAITELNFSPHPAARQLVMRRTNMIGLLLPEISGAFFQPMLKGIETGVREAGYNLLVYSTQNGHAYRPLGEYNTDGLIIFPGSVEDSELQRLYRLDFPVVLLHQPPPQDSPYPVVTVENKSGAERLIDHLIETHGRRQIVYLHGPERHEDSLWRERGYRESLTMHGIPFNPTLVAYGGFNESEAFNTIGKMLLAKIEFDAVFAGDDDAAAGVITAIKRSGRDVPNDISVVGFDDVPFSRFFNPPLTTVRAPIEQVGHEAVRLLLRYIQKQANESKVLFPTEIIIRQSCGCRSDTSINRSIGPQGGETR